MLCRSPVFASKSSACCGTKTISLKSFCFVDVCVSVPIFLYVCVCVCMLVCAPACLRASVCVHLCVYAVQAPYVYVYVYAHLCACATSDNFNLRVASHTHFVNRLLSTPTHPVHMVRNTLAQIYVACRCKLRPIVMTRLATRVSVVHVSHMGIVGRSLSRCMVGVYSLNVF